MQYRIIFCLVAVALLVGTVSADTLILYIDANAQDGYLSETSDNSWQTMRDDAGDGVTTTSSSIYSPALYSTTTNDVYGEFRRAFFIFNTSKLDDTVVIDSTVFSVYIINKGNNLGDINIALTPFSPASNTTVAAGDYDSFSNTRITDYINYGSIATGVYNNFTITNLSWIDKTGFLRFMLRDQWDIGNNTTGLTWTSGTTKYSGVRIRDTSYLSTTPFLTITYHTGGGDPPVASFTINKNFIRIPNSVTVTDTSTNTPTSWQWSWGDGTANSTTQNPTHQYLKRGKWDIILTATNAGGSGTSGATSVRVTGYEYYY